MGWGAMVELMGQTTWMGGSPGPSSAVNTVYRMDGDGEWTTAPPMLTRRRGHCVVVFDNDVAIITGGRNDDSYVVSSVERYSLDGRRTRMKPMTTPRTDHGCSMTTKNGVSTVIVAGGGDEDGNSLASVETLALASHEDLTTATWRQVGRLPAARSHFPIVNIGDRLVILGGFSGVGRRLKTVLASEDGEQWDLLPDRLKMTRAGHTAVSTETLC